MYRLCYGTLHAASEMLPFLLHPPFFGTLRVGVDVIIIIHGYVEHLFSVRCYQGPEDIRQRPSAK
jgi:hypothetical protein